MVKNTVIKGNSAQGLWGATLGFFVGFASVSLFGPMVKYLKETGETLSPAMIGLLLSIPALSGSLLRIPFAAWVDTTGGRKPFIVLLVLASVGLIGIYFLISLGVAVQYFSLLLFFGFLAGCGIATFSVGIGQTSYWFKQSQQGFALGTYAGVGNIAPGFFTLLLTTIALPYLGIVNSYLAWFVFLIIGLVLYILLGRNAWSFQLIKAGHTKEEAEKIAKEQYHQELFPRVTVKESLLASAKAWQTWGLVVVYFVTFGGFVALTAWLPKYWLEYWQVNLALAGSLTSLYSILASVVRVFGGKLSDVAGGKTVAIYSLALTAIGSILMVYSSSIGMAVFSIVVLAIAMGVGNAAVFKLLPREVPHAIGGAAGWVGGLGAFGGFVIPNVLSRFLKGNESFTGGDTGYAAGFWVFAVLAIISIFVLSRFSSDKRR